MINETEMRSRAEAWLTDITRAPRRQTVTRDNYIGEEVLALDVLDLLAEVQRMRPVYEAAKEWRTFVRILDDGALIEYPGHLKPMKAIADAISTALTSEGSK